MRICTCSTKPNARSACSPSFHVHDIDGNICKREICATIRSSGRHSGPGQPCSSKSSPAVTKVARSEVYVINFSITWAFHANGWCWHHQYLPYWCRKNKLQLHSDQIRKLSPVREKRWANQNHTVLHAWRPVANGTEQLSAHPDECQK